MFCSCVSHRIQSSYSALQRINQDLEDKIHRNVSAHIGHTLKKHKLNKRCLGEHTRTAFCFNVRMLCSHMCLQVLISLFKCFPVFNGFWMKVFTSLSALLSMCVRVLRCDILVNALSMYNSAECTKSLFEYQ